MILIPLIIKPIISSGCQFHIVTLKITKMSRCQDAKMSSYLRLQIFAIF